MNQLADTADAVTPDTMKSEADRARSPRTGTFVAAAWPDCSLSAGPGGQYDVLALLQEYRLQLNELALTQFIRAHVADPQIITLANAVIRDQESAIDTLELLAGENGVTLPELRAVLPDVEYRALSRFSQEKLIRYFLSHHQNMFTWSVPVFNSYKRVIETGMLTRYAANLLASLQERTSVIALLAKEWRLDYPETVHKSLPAEG